MLSKQNRDPSASEREGPLSCWLAEFKSLREEMVERLRNQMISILANITILGTITSIVLSIEQDPPVILLVIPFVSSSLGLFYLNQGFTGADIARYIDDTIVPELRKLVKSDLVFNWERRTKTSQFWSPRELTIHTAVVVIFLLPGIAGLFANARIALPTDHLYLTVAWWSGLVLMIILFIGLMAQWRHWKGSRGRE